MATGRLGVTAIPATTNTTTYTCPTGYYAVCNVSITNRNATAITVRLALAAGGTPASEEWIEYDAVIIPNGTYERTGLVLQSGLNIVVYSSAASVGCTVYGIETATS